MCGKIRAKPDWAAAVSPDGVAETDADSLAYRVMNDLPVIVFDGGERYVMPMRWVSLIPPIHGGRVPSMPAPKRSMSRPASPPPSATASGASCWPKVSTKRPRMGPSMS